MKSFLRRNGAWIGFTVLLIAMTLATHGGFLSPRNLTNLMRQASINGILATGMTAIILTGGIDLSIGSIVALAGVVAGISQVSWGWGANGFTGGLASAGLAMAIGLAAGMINGGLIATLGIPPFVITLGMMVIARGLAMILSGGASISPMGDSLGTLADSFVSGSAEYVVLAVIATGILYLALQTWRHDRARTAELIFPAAGLALGAFAFTQYRGVPILVAFLAFAALSTGVILRYSALGRGVYAFGSNPRAAFWAGVPVRRVMWSAYAGMGLLAGLGAALLTARLNGADPNAGQLFELDAIAAVVIGGTSLRGGQGTVLGSLVGALTIATLNNGMDLLGVQSFYQMVLKGLIIILAVAMDSNQRQAQSGSAT